jgi:hypothetical protein
MNFNFTKKYIKNQNQINLASSYDEVKHIANLYDENILSKNTQDLLKIADSFNLSCSSGIYIGNYKIWKIVLHKNGINQENFFTSNIELVNWVNKYFKLLQKCGGLEIFIELEKFKNASILVHYQGDLIIKKFVNS